jgi:SWI/SNF-related matrix-associated actin-dependent regulator 1 of chromatin subfamily A
LQALPYQETGIEFLSNLSAAGLWDAPGLGKTFQALASAKKIKAKNIIVTCPASVRMVWDEECQKMNIDSHIVTEKSQIGRGLNVLSYEGAIKMKTDLMMYRWDGMINDEGHFLKNHEAKRTQAIYGEKLNKNGGIASKVGFTWDLTGTPMPNNPSELFPKLHTLFPDAITKNNGEVMDYWNFMHRYCNFYYDNFDRLRVKKGKNLSELRDKLRGRILRRKKEEVLKDLPAVSYQTLPVEGDLRGIDLNVSREIKECLSEENPLDQLHNMEIHMPTLRRIIGMAKVPAVKQWVKESPYDKIVIYAHHSCVIDELRKLPSSVVIDGRCNQEQREKAKNDFQHGSARIFIGQNKAAGTGLTLTAGSIMLMVEPEWSPADNIQIKDRISRIGQKNKCLIYLVMIPGTIDEAIIRVIRAKMEDYREIGL